MSMNNDLKCPANLTGQPCPLHGGQTPPLELGPGGGTYSGTQVLPTGSDKHKFGVCNACNGLIMTDMAGNPIRVLLRPITPR
jgi:hypothetical protein